MNTVDFVARFRAEHRTQVIVATSFVAMGLPYVFLTNTSASPMMIILHAFLLWFLVPVFSSGLFTIAGSYRQTSTLSVDLLVQAVGLAAATGAMLMTLNIFARVPWDQLLVRPLITALVPIYSWYILYRLFLHWQSQKTLAIRREAARAKAEWEAMNVRIQPHFLFNTLTSLEELIATDAPKAREFVRKLAGLFRGVLGGLELETDLLKTEMEVARSYLELQQLRFGQRLEFTIDGGEGNDQVRIPKNVLITMVENAVKHGAEGARKTCHIKVNAHRNPDDQFVVSVTNPTHKSSGGAQSLGMTDIKKRLDAVAEGTALFRFSIADGTAVAELVTARAGGLRGWK